LERREGRIRFGIAADVKLGIEQCAAAWTPSIMGRERMTKQSSTTLSNVGQMARSACCVFAACALGFASAMLLPIASADVLGNGYDVSCKQANANQVICSISGCPRVHEDLAGDVVHTKVNGGEQSELDKACGNTTSQTINSSSGFTYSVQGCRKRPSVLSDLCGPFSDYTFTPPPKPADKPVNCPPGSKTPTVPAGQQCQAAPQADVQCPPDSPVKTVPAGQTCPAAPPVINAIQLQFGPPHLGGITATITNSSALTAKCTYDSTPFNTHRDFTVAPNGKTDLTFTGINTNTNYHVVVSCHDASGKQTQEIGHQETNVAF
jgi:hypothetical protein